MTILPGATNQGEESTHHPAARAAIPQDSPSTPATVQGTARAPPAMFRLRFLALCHDSNAEQVALAGGGRPPGRGGQKDPAGHWGCHTALFGQETLSTEEQPWGMERRQKGRSLLLLSGSSVTDCTTGIHLPGFEDPLLGFGNRRNTPFSPPNIHLPVLADLEEAGGRCPACGSTGNPPSPQHHSLCTVDVFRDSLMPRNARDSCSQ